MDQFAKKFKEFLLGFVLMPWIWIWGYYILFSLFAYLFSRIENREEIELLIQSKYSLGLGLNQIWTLVGAFLITNYTLTLFVNAKYSKLKNILFLSSLLLLLLLGFFAWSYFREALNQA